MGSVVVEDAALFFRKPSDAQAINVLDFATSYSQRSAIRSGSVEIDAAWADAVAAAQAAGSEVTGIFLPAGNYEIADDAELENPGLVVIGEGPATVINKNGLLSAFKATGGGLTLNSITLDSDAAIGDKTVTVSTGLASSLAVGETYVILSTANPNGTTVGRRAEFVTVQAISGDDVTFWGPLRQSFAVSDSAEIATVDLLEGVGFRDLTVRMDNGITVDSTLGYQSAFGINLEWCNGAVVRNVSMSDGVHAAIRLHGNKGARITNFSARDFGSATTGTSDPASTEGSGGFGYGIREEGLNLGLIASGLTFERMRHGYTTIHGYSSYRYGVPIGSIISDGVHIDAKSVGWDTHWGGIGIQFIGLRVIGGRFHGFQIRSERTRLIGCSVSDVDLCALYFPSSNNSNYCVVRDFSSYRTNLTTNGVFGDSREFGAVLDDGVGNSIEARVELCGGPALTIGYQAVAAGGDYDIEAIDPCQLAATNTMACHVRSANSLAKLQINRLKVRSSDAKVTDLIQRDAANYALEAFNVRGVGHTGRTFKLIGGDTFFQAVACETAGIAERRGKKFSDDFLARTLSTAWTTNKQASVAANASIVTGSDGSALTLTTGTNASGAIGDNSLRAEVRNAVAAGDIIVAEWEIKLSATSNVNVFIGFTSATNNANPAAAIGAGDALSIIDSAANVCGLVYDTAADTDMWHGVSCNGSTPGTPLSMGVAPSANVYARWRIELDASGNATFLRNGEIKGYIAAAVSPTARLAPIVAGFSRSATARDISVRAFSIECGRSP